MKRSVIDLLPPPAGGSDFSVVRRQVAEGRTKIAVLDDDPTGTQTVHGLDVLADWSVGMLTGALSDPRPCFYILANTRSMPAEQASEVVEEISNRLAAAAEMTQVPCVIISRGDSTLRGHFAEELGAIERGFGAPFDAKIVIPAFFEGGRYTLDDVHYVLDGDELVPAADTEFARDRTFGYRNSSLPQWIEEKTKGATAAATVVSIPIAMLRGPEASEAVTRKLLGLPKGTYVVVNAAAYADLEVFALGIMGAEAAGRRYLFRTAASFVRVRAGLEGRSLLAPAEISDRTEAGGLIVVGSYVRKTTVQLESALTLPNVDGIEVTVNALGEPATRAGEIARVAEEAQRALRSGRHAIVFTSRSHKSAIGDAGDLAAGRIVSEALVDIVRAIPLRPRFLVAKGGVTSSDLAVHGLGMRKALVLGQGAPGVPVWKMGSETRYPGMNFVVWPGNVGSPEALRDFIQDA
jgi:uncharacterized protein YgbK (DUF1537 family)